MEWERSLWKREWQKRLSVYATHLNHTKVGVYIYGLNLVILYKDNKRRKKRDAKTSASEDDPKHIKKAKKMRYCINNVAKFTSTLAKFMFLFDL